MTTEAVDHRTGRSEEEVADNPRQGKILELQPDGRAVVAVTTQLRTALAIATVATLSAAARPWAETDELDGSDPADLTEVLVALADLARRASSRGDNLYCLVTL
ncbi:hypothetical protein [Dactylosporangium darangshiense]|uniref:Uncharacterized protein n=1 Tax=Dactylosporangium darangshiense TaxID=579108 RepID=A0ABP8DG31_9ACTN